MFEDRVLNLVLVPTVPLLLVVFNESLASLTRDAMEYFLRLNLAAVRLRLVMSSSVVPCSIPRPPADVAFVVEFTRSSVS